MVKLWRISFLNHWNLPFWINHSILISDILLLRSKTFLCQFWVLSFTLKLLTSISYRISIRNQKVYLECIKFFSRNCSQNSLYTKTRWNIKMKGWNNESWVATYTTARSLISFLLQTSFFTCKTDIPLFKRWR